MKVGFVTLGCDKNTVDSERYLAQLSDYSAEYGRAAGGVVGDRVAAIGWSQGGVYAMAVINGPSLDRAKRRGVELPH